MTEDILFDNLLITDDISVADKLIEDRFDTNNKLMLICTKVSPLYPRWTFRKAGETPLFI